MADPQRAPLRTAQRLSQRRKIMTDANMFELDLSRKPDGYAYAWRRVSLAGQEDTRRQIVSETNGWEPVPASRHPELMGTRSGDEPIILGGQMLMEIPQEWEQEMRDIDTFQAKYVLEETMMRMNGEVRRSGVGKGVKRHAANISELVE